MEVPARVAQQTLLQPTNQPTNHSTAYAVMGLGLEFSRYSIPPCPAERGIFHDMFRGEQERLPQGGPSFRPLVWGPRPAFKEKPPNQTKPNQTSPDFDGYTGTANQHPPRICFTICLLCFTICLWSDSTIVFTICFTICLFISPD
jgi:hypothetical protein